jgi:FtsP/CotA-like multicopper oxidase with cupredoxin domain
MATLAAAGIAATTCGCGGSSDAIEPVPYAEPPELTPDASGVYTLDFGPSAVEIGGKRYCLRTYNGSVPGPTLRVPAGQDRRIHVDLHNRFTKSDYREIISFAGHGSTSCHDFNTTNLHGHGLHVQPTLATADPADPCSGDGCGPSASYYGDNVLHDVKPGESARYRWDLDEDGTHHAGTDWYHPHVHGSTAQQLLNGAAGALIIEGDIDTVPGVASAKERVLMVTQMSFDPKYTTPLPDGTDCTEDTLSANESGANAEEAKPNLVNGKLLPRMSTPPGQVERWRLIHGGSPAEMGIKLHPAVDGNCDQWDITHTIDFVQIARDGLTLPEFYTSDTMWVSPGYRIDAMVKMPAEKQTLCLVARRPSDPLGSVMMIVDVDPSAGTATETSLPAESAVAAVAKPTTWMGVVDGQMQEVSCDSVETVHQKVALLVPTPGDTMPHLETATPGSCDPTHDHGGIDPNLPVCVCPEPNINCRRFDERRAWGYRSDRVMTVDTSERWEIVAFDGHPFHIHINPFLVCPNHSNKGPNFAHWRDTYWVQAEDGPQYLMMNYRKFTGQLVLHCHKLNHEDEGMMELVEICKDGDTSCLCQGTDAMGNCISQAGCKDADKRCQFAASAAESAPLPPPPDPALCGP